MHQQNCVPPRAGSLNRIPVMVNNSLLDHGHLPVQGTPTGILINPVGAAPAINTRPGNKYQDIFHTSTGNLVKQVGTAPAINTRPGNKYQEIFQTPTGILINPVGAAPAINTRPGNKYQEIFHTRTGILVNQVGTALGANSRIGNNFQELRHTPTGILVSPVGTAPVTIRNARQSVYVRPIQVFNVEDSFTQRVVSQALPILPGAFVPHSGETLHTRVLGDPYQCENVPLMQILPTRMEICMPFASDDCEPVVTIQEYATTQMRQRSRPNKRGRVLPPAVEIIDLDEYCPSVNFAGGHNTTMANHITRDQPRCTRSPGAQAGIKNVHNLIALNNNPTLILGGHTNCKWVQQVTPVGQQPIKVICQQQGSRVSVHSPIMSPCGPTATIGFPVSVIEPREQGSTGVGLRQAESIVENILDSFTVDLPELNDTLITEPGTLVPGPEAKNIKEPVPIHKLISSTPLSSQFEKPRLSVAPCRKKKSCKVISIPPSDIPPSSAQTPPSFAGVAQYDVSELISSLPDSLDFPILTKLCAQTPLFDDISKLVSSLPDSVQDGKILPTPHPVSGALWETEDVIKLMSSPLGGGKLLKDGTAGLVAHDAHDAMQSGISLGAATASSPKCKRKLTDVQGSTSEVSPEEVPSQPKYQKCCCRKDGTGETSGRAHNRPSTCDLVTMPWTEFFELVADQNKKKRTSKKSATAKKRKRKQSKVNEFHPERSGKKVRY